MLLRVNGGLVLYSSELLNPEGSHSKPSTRCQWHDTILRAATLRIVGKMPNTIENDKFQIFKSFPTITINFFNSIINLFNCLYSGMQIKNYIETFDKNVQLRIEPKLLRIFDETSLLFTWARRLLLYFAFYVVIISLHLYFKRFDWWHTDVDRFRALLGVLITSEAAILAIVVSLSLVAVQLAASSYSARVIEVFRKAPDLWILIGVYGAAMFYGLWALNQTNSLEAHIVFSYYLGIFAFVALGPYIWNTLETLKPSTVIKMLTGEITAQKILDVAGKKKEKPDDKDPIQPIIDIVNGSIMKYDYETQRIGLKAIGDCGSRILNMSLKNDDKIKIAKHILEHFVKVGNLTINKEDGYFSFEVVKNMTKIGLTSIENFDDESFGIAFYFGEIGEAATKKNLLDEICWVSFDLGEIGETAAKYGRKEMPIQATIYLGKMGKISAEKELLDAVSHVIASIRRIGTGAYLERGANESIEALKIVLDACPINKKYEDTISEAIESFGWVGREMVKFNPDDYRLFGAVTFLGEFGKKVSEHSLDKAACKAASSLQLIAVASSNKQLKWSVIEAQNEIGKNAAKSELNSTTWEAAMSIGNLGTEVSDDQKLKSLEFLEEIGLLACKHGTKLESANRQVVDSIYWIGKTAVEPDKENESIVLKAISSLEKLGKVAEKNLDGVTLHTVAKLNEFKSIINKDGKSTEIGGRILYKLKQVLRKFK